MKKLWEKPELMVLVRARPEESVLEACKIPSQSTGPDFNKDKFCKFPPDNPGVPCPTCSQDATT